MCMKSTGFIKPMKKLSTKISLYMKKKFFPEFFSKGIYIHIYTQTYVDFKSYLPGT